MQNTSLKDSLLNDLSFNETNLGHVKLYSVNFFNYLIIKAFINIKNDHIKIDDYSEIARYREKLYFIVVEINDEHFVIGMIYRSHPKNCFMIAKQLKLFLDKYDVGNNIDNVFDFKKRKYVSKSTNKYTDNLIIKINSPLESDLYNF